MRHFLTRHFKTRQFLTRHFRGRVGVDSIVAGERVASFSGGASVRARRRGEVSADGADEELALLAAILEAAEDVL